MAGMQMMMLGARGQLRVTVSAVSGSALGAGVDGFVASENGPATTVSGGSPGYTYTWTYLSGSLAITTGTPSAQNPVWSATVSSDIPEVSTWRVTVQDAASAIVTADVVITLTYTQI